MIRTLFVNLLSLHILHGQRTDECYAGDIATRELRKWALTEDINVKTYNIKFYETDLTLIREEEGPSWYLAGGGWQGAYYYESGAPGESRAGAYLYPDYSTAVVGLWMDHLLLQGKATKLGEACRSGATWILKFAELEGPILKYSPPSHYSLGINELQRDPYEVKTVEVKQSRIEGAEEGLFTKRDVVSGEVLAFYSGYIINCDSSLRALDRRYLSDDEEHLRNMYNIALDLEEGEHLCIDLPPDLGNDVQRYNATLGHKVNHSFEPSSEFVLFAVHPTLGTIMSLVALQDIPANQELTVNYGYNCTTDPDQPDWFKTQWNNFYQEEDQLHDHQEL